MSEPNSGKNGGSSSRKKNHSRNNRRKNRKNDSRRRYGSTPRKKLEERNAGIIKDMENQARGRFEQTPLPMGFPEEMEQPKTFKFDWKLSPVPLKDEEAMSGEVMRKGEFGWLDDARVDEIADLVKNRDMTLDQVLSLRSALLQQKTVYGHGRLKSRSKALLRLYNEGINVVDLSKKFGALNSEAAGLLRLVKQHAKKIGLSFHVGSQCMHPISYSKGINEIGNIIKKTKILPDYINVGGGFPTIYPDLIPQSMESYFNEIKKGLENLKLEKLPEIICEPGRALVAESGSTIVRVNLRKKQKLYINDGTYGTLFDAGTPNIVFPSKMIKDNTNKIISKKLTAFDFFGPTCDSMDYMKGPFLLPNNIKENDYIELGQLGAYGLTFRTQFNGYYSDEIYEVEDKPIMTMYDKDINKATLVA